MIVLFIIIHENRKANVVAEEVSCKVLWVIVIKSELHNQSREAQGKTTTNVDESFREEGSKLLKEKKMGFLDSRFAIN